MILPQGKKSRKYEIAGNNYSPFTCTIYRGLTKQVLGDLLTVSVYCLQDRMWNKQDYDIKCLWQHHSCAWLMCQGHITSDPVSSSKGDKRCYKPFWGSFLSLSFSQMIHLGGVKQAKKYLHTFLLRGSLWSGSSYVQSHSLPGLLESKNHNWARFAHYAMTQIVIYEPQCCGSWHAETKPNRSHYCLQLGSHSVYVKQRKFVNPLRTMCDPEVLWPTKGLELHLNPPIATSASRRRCFFIL